MQRSIEVEYWVIDRDGALASPGPLTDVSEYAEGEFVDPLFELKTPPCETYADLRSTFLEQLETVLERADELGKGLVPLGTPVNGERVEQSPGERGRIQRRVLGTNFDYAKYCAGTHLHFEKRNVTDQLNVLIGLDPALSLLSSSPYFHGEHVASSARAFLYRKKCYEHFPDHGQLTDYVDNVGEWERRLEERFAEFVAAAVEAGVDEERVRANFSPDTAVWTPVRLRDAMPTVEWRSPDTSLPSQVLRLAREVGDVMERLYHTTVTIEGTRGSMTDGGITLPQFAAVLNRAETAMRDGLTSSDLVAYLERMGFDVADYDPITRRIEGREYVSPADARELRKRYAERLRRDVRELRPEASSPRSGEFAGGR